MKHILRISCLLLVGTISAYAQHGGGSQGGHGGGSRGSASMSGGGSQGGPGMNSGGGSQGHSAGPKIQSGNNNNRVVATQPKQSAPRVSSHESGRYDSRYRTARYDGPDRGSRGPRLDPIWRNGRKWVYWLGRYIDYDYYYRYYYNRYPRTTTYYYTQPYNDGYYYEDGYYEDEYYDDRYYDDRYYDPNQQTVRVIYVK